MKKEIAFFILLIYLLTSCQQEIFRPVTPPVNIVPERVVAAIVISNVVQNEFDSIVFRYQADKISEVHYSRNTDSFTRAYYYDGADRLSKIEDGRALYYTNSNIAHSIYFQYNSAGQLVKTFTDFETVSAVPAYYNYTSIGNMQQLIVYDTSYVSSSYNLNWANRTIYNTISTDNYLLYDSCISFNYASGKIKTDVSDFTYDADKNAINIRQYTYQDGQLFEWGTVTATYNKPAPIYEELRKKLYRNLSNWYEASSVSQDDSYRFFSFPGHMYKKLSYSGYSSYGGTVPLTVLKGIEYKNEYDNDLLVKSVVTFSVTGQGTIHYVNDIRYYYRYQ